MSAMTAAYRALQPQSGEVADAVRPGSVDIADSTPSPAHPDPTEAALHNLACAIAQVERCFQADPPQGRAVLVPRLELTTARRALRRLHTRYLDLP